VGRRGLSQVTSKNASPRSRQIKVSVISLKTEERAAKC
jgi:hypothetical protein